MGDWNALGCLWVTLGAAGLTNPWHACPKWHAVFSAVTIFSIMSFARPASLYCEEYLFTQTVYELPLLPNNTAVKPFYANWERCEVLTGYLSVGRRSGGE